MNAIILIAILFLTELCFGTLLPPTGKNKKEKGKHSNKVSNRRKYLILIINVNNKILIINILFAFICYNKSVKLYTYC